MKKLHLVIFIVIHYNSTIGEGACKDERYLVYDWRNVGLWFTNMRFLTPTSVGYLSYTDTFGYGIDIYPISMHYLFI